MVLLTGIINILGLGFCFSNVSFADMPSSGRWNFTRSNCFFSRYIFKAFAPRILRAAFKAAENIKRTKKKKRFRRSSEGRCNIIWNRGMLCIIYMYCKHRHRLLLRPYFFIFFLRGHFIYCLSFRLVCVSPSPRTPFRDLLNW